MILGTCTCTRIWTLSLRFSTWSHACPEHLFSYDNSRVCKSTQLNHKIIKNSIKSLIVYVSQSLFIILYNYLFTFSCLFSNSRQKLAYLQRSDDTSRSGFWCYNDNDNEREFEYVQNGTSRPLQYCSFP